MLLQYSNNFHTLPKSGLVGIKVDVSDIVTTEISEVMLDVCRNVESNIVVIIFGD